MQKIILKIKNKKGFVIIFAVTLSAILLAIALGVSNIALKEIRFGTNARDTNDAFFAADTGLEQALYNDKYPSSVCTITSPATSCSTSFVIIGLGSQGQSCVKVTASKTLTPLATYIDAKGYNTGGTDSSCVSSSTSRVEREIKASY
ncbi:MAG: pilus assembly PilX N-terminal domain-containing protein [bacterium]